MRNFKILSIAFVLLFTLACSDDEDNTNTTPITINVNSTINWSLFNASNTDLTSLVTFNGEASNTFTINAIKGDKVNFNFNFDNNNALNISREIRFIRVEIDNANADDGLFLEALTYIQDPDNPNTGANLGFEIGQNTPNTYDAKFNLIVQVVENGIALSGLYSIDPKIRVRPSR